MFLSDARPPQHFDAKIMAPVGLMATSVVALIRAPFIGGGNLPLG